MGHSRHTPCRMQFVRTKSLGLRLAALHSTSKCELGQDPQARPGRLPMCGVHALEIKC